MSIPTPAPLNKAQTWNILCHASALIGLIIPLGFLIGPFIVWLIKRGEFSSVDANGKESLNFQLSVLIYVIVAMLLQILGVGPILLILVALADVVLVIIASIKISQGETFHYPATIKFLR